MKPPVTSRSILALPVLFGVMLAAIAVAQTSAPVAAKKSAPTTRMLQHWQYFETHPIEADGWGVKLDLLGSSRMEATLTALRQLNLTSGFTLTAESRAAIVAVHKDWRAVYTKFQVDNGDDLEKWFDDAMKILPRHDAKEIAEFLRRRAELAAKCPGVEDYLTKIRAVLTPEQSAALDARLKEFANAEKAKADAGDKFRRYMDRMREKTEAGRSRGL